MEVELQGSVILQMAEPLSFCVVLYNIPSLTKI